MKIAFVNGPYEHLGVGYISAVLKEKGYETRLFCDPRLFDDNIVSLKPLARFFDLKARLISELKAYRPDLIGFSVMTDDYQWACTLAKMIKQEMDVPVIFGGNHPTAVPDRVIRNDSVDIVCVGEGEYPMLELVQSMAKGAADTSIKNLWFKKDGRVIANEVRPLIEDLDALPFPDKDLYYKVSPHFRKAYSIAASRGCFFSCSFCWHSYYSRLYKGKGMPVRTRSVASVLDELSRAKERSWLSDLGFVDDCFGHDPAWLKLFSQQYRQAIGKRFMCIMDPRHVSPEVVGYLKDACCGEIMLGIQSLEPEVKDKVMNRKVSMEQMAQAIRLIKGSKITIAVDNIFGLPGQDVDEFMRSLLFYVPVRPDRILFYTLKYYPLIDVTLFARQNGYLSDEKFEAIMEGRDAGGLCVDSFLDKRGDPPNVFRGVRNFLAVFDCLPGKAIRFIIEKKKYRSFLGFLNPAILFIVRTLFATDSDSVYMKATACSRYFYFTKCLFIFKLRKACR